MANSLDPHVASLEEIKAVSGLEFSAPHCRGGEVPQPPICHTLGFRLAAVSMTPAFRPCNPIGTAHGGVASTVA
jgi:hypothetical protein